jgi:hypothetical protein
MSATGRERLLPSSPNPDLPPQGQLADTADVIDGWSGDIADLVGHAENGRMGRRAIMASTVEEATHLSLSELDRQIAIARWRVGVATKSTLRNLARKRLDMLEAVRSDRTSA